MTAIMNRMRLPADDSAIISNPERNALPETQSPRPTSNTPGSMFHTPNGFSHAEYKSFVPAKRPHPIKPNVEQDIRQTKREWSNSQALHSIGSNPLLEGIESQASPMQRSIYGGIGNTSRLASFSSHGLNHGMAFRGISHGSTSPKHYSDAASGSHGFHEQIPIDTTGQALSNRGTHGYHPIHTTEHSFSSRGSHGSAVENLLLPRVSRGSDRGSHGLSPIPKPNNFGSSFNRPAGRSAGNLIDFDEDLNLFAEASSVFPMVSHGVADLENDSDSMSGLDYGGDIGDSEDGDEDGFFEAREIIDHREEAKSTPAKTASSPRRCKDKNKNREVLNLSFVVWSPTSQRWEQIESLPQATQDAIQSKFESLYGTTLKSKKDRCDRLARMMDPKNIGKYLGRNQCLAGSLIDRKKVEIEGSEGCKTCWFNDRICVALVEVNEEVKLGVWPVVASRREGSESDCTFWVRG